MEFSVGVFWDRLEAFPGEHQVAASSGNDGVVLENRQSANVGRVLAVFVRRLFQPQPRVARGREDLAEGRSVVSGVIGFTFSTPLRGPVTRFIEGLSWEML